MADLQTSVAVTDAALVTTDVTTNDASTTKHGFLKKLDNTATNFMNGAGNWAAPAGSALSTSSNQLSGNVTMTNANTYYDGPTLTLAAGTWLLISSVTVDAADNNANVTQKLWDGTTVFASGQTQAATGSQVVNITLTAIVAPAGSTTYKVSAASDAAAGTILAAAPTNGAGNNASTLVAVKAG